MALRVLHIGKFYPPVHGGMEVFLAELIQAQREMGMEAYALVHGQAQVHDPDWLVRVPVQMHLAYTPIALGFRSAMAKAIERFEPHVLHLHVPNNSVFWALTLAAARDIPWVVHWHSDVVVSRFRAVLAFGYQIYRSFEQAVLWRAERIFVTSPPYLQASEPLATWQEKCVVVPLGLGPVHTLDPRDDRSTSGVESPWREGRLRLLSIGRLTYYKGFETLIRTVAGRSDAQLLIVGGGELRPQLQNLIRTTASAGGEPAIRLLGEVSEDYKQELLETCDVFCLASRERTEAFGLVLLEAMRCARPCLVSDLEGSGMPWLVQQSGCGWLVQTDNVAAWQTAIAHCVTHPAERAERGRAGLRALTARFSIAACAKAVETQYRALLADAPSTESTRDILVVIPARDEVMTIGEVVKSLREGGWADVLVVDDQSVDGTADAADRAGARILRAALPLGAWGGIQAGIRYGLSRGYRGVITMDADGQHEAGEIPALLAQRELADLVIGASPERASPARRIAWHWFRRIAGFDLLDLTSGFRYYNEAAMQILASPEATLLDYQDVGILLMLRRAGLRIVEVPVKMSLRTTGKSRIFNSWLSVARYMAITTLLCLSRWRVGPRTLARKEQR